jgi:hypothetical protein
MCRVDLQAASAADARGFQLDPAVHTPAVQASWSELDSAI